MCEAVIGAILSFCNLTPQRAFVSFIDISPSRLNVWSQLLQSQISYVLMYMDMFVHEHGAPIWIHNIRVFILTPTLGSSPKDKVFLNDMSYIQQLWLRTVSAACIGVYILCFIFHLNLLKCSRRRPRAQRCLPLAISFPCQPPSLILNHGNHLIVWAMLTCLKYWYVNVIREESFSSQ